MATGRHGAATSANPAANHNQACRKWSVGCLLRMPRSAMDSELENFLRQIHILLTGTAALVVVDDGHAHDLGFAQLVVGVDQGLEGLVAVDLLQLAVDDLRGRGPLVVEGDQHPGGDGRIGLLANQVDEF